MTRALPRQPAGPFYVEEGNHRRWIQFFGTPAFVARQMGALVAGGFRWHGGQGLLLQPGSFLMLEPFFDCRVFDPGVFPTLGLAPKPGCLKLIPAAEGGGVFILQVQCIRRKGGDSHVCMCSRDKRRNDKECNNEQQEKENISNLRNNA
jgi:hypothetical protein